MKFSHSGLRYGFFLGCALGLLACGSGNGTSAVERQAKYDRRVMEVNCVGQGGFLMPSRGAFDCQTPDNRLVPIENYRPRG